VAKYGIAFKGVTGAQFVAAVDNLKQDAVRFLLSDKQWEKYSGVTRVLKWEMVRFAKSEKSKVPKKRGIYCFAVQPPIANGPPILYPIYIGETGNTSRGTLNGRFGQYFQDQAKLKRAHVHYALNKWKSAIQFLFAIVSSGDLKKIEAILNGAYVPPFSHEDFDAVLRKAVSAWRHS
jgi:hypothetical protein